MSRGQPLIPLLDYNRHPFMRLTLVVNCSVSTWRHIASPIGLIEAWPYSFAAILSHPSPRDLRQLAGFFRRPRDTSGAV